MFSVLFVVDRFVRWFVVEHVAVVRYLFDALSTWPKVVEAFPPVYSSLRIVIDDLFSYLAEAP